MTVVSHGFRCLLSVFDDDVSGLRVFLDSSTVKFPTQELTCMS
jgi:hypothetical protein